MAARHILSANQATADFMRRTLGLPTEADTFEQETRQKFGALPLDALLRLSKRALPDSTVCASLTRLVRGSPERMTAANWDRAFNSCGRTQGFRATRPGSRLWFPPAPPTTPASRLMASEIALGLTLPAVESMRAVAPYKSDVLLAYSAASTARRRGRTSSSGSTAARRKPALGHARVAGNWGTIRPAAASSWRRCARAPRTVA